MQVRCHLQRVATQVSCCDVLCAVCCVQLWNYYNTPGLFKPEKLLDTDTTIHDAVVLLLRTWQLEQHHEEKST